MPEADIRPVTPFPSGAGEEPPLTVLSEGDAFEGRLEMRGDGHVLGSFRGHIECGGELLIGPDARVSADVRTLHLTVSGLLAGNVLARGRLKITATGQLRGDAEVASLVVQEGGVHQGVLRVHPEGIPEAPAELQQPATAASGQTVQDGVAREHPLGSEPAAAPPSRALSVPVGRVKRLWGGLF